MGYNAYITGWVSRVRAAVSAVRWRDPLVQSWGLIGGLLVAGIVAQYGAGRGTGEQKNQGLFNGTLSRELPEGEWRPSVILKSARAIPGLPQSETEGELDLRALTVAAAAHKSWHYVPPRLRNNLQSMPPVARQITVTWSHTNGGDAGALALHHRRTFGDSAPLPYDFVIGNGRRSQDGLINAQARWSPELPVQPEGIHICLAGQPGKPTRAQAEALGELITCLEARCGTLPLAMKLSDKPPAVALNTIN